MAGRGRPPGFVMTAEHRAKIANSQILKRLIDHVEGKTEMTPTQVSAGLGLLKKVMPDMTATEITGAEGGPVQIAGVELAFIRPNNPPADG
jgi:hypothetical protein